MPIERMKLVLVLGGAFVFCACPSGDSPNDDPSESDAGEILPDAGEDPGDEPLPEPKPQPNKPAADGGTKPNPAAPSEPSTPSKPTANNGNTGNTGTGGQTPAKPAEMGNATPRDPQHFFMPTPEPRNTQFPRTEFDAKGGLHAVYPAYAGGGAFYAYCPNNCVDPKAMKVVALPTDSAPNTAMLALTADGRPRVLLPTFLRLYYAECDRECTNAANWTTSVIVDHQGLQEVTGDVLAVDSKGRPRFIMHTYVAYLGVGQKEPHTYYAQCDTNCSDGSSWQIDSIQDQMWQYSTLRFDPQDRAHLSTVIISPASSVKQLAYVRCDSNCESEASWNGIQVAPAFELSTAEIRPSLSFALTSKGGVRMAGLVMPEPGARALVYFECDQNCVEDNWSGAILTDKYELGSGVDIQVDAKDRPRLVFTLDDNIGLYSCDDGDCANAAWDLTKVEFASDLKPDTIILWPNCIADAWLLHDPTLTLAADGSARVGYTATDVSGGFNPKPDPTMTPCLAGKDMTLARMTVLPAI